MDDYRDMDKAVNEKREFEAFQAGWRAAYDHLEPGCGPGSSPSTAKSAFKRWKMTCSAGHTVRLKECAACKLVPDPPKPKSWRDEDMTDKQRNLLRDLGERPSDDLTKGEASDLITKLINLQKLERRYAYADQDESDFGLDDDFFDPLEDPWEAFE